MKEKLKACAARKPKPGSRQTTGFAVGGHILGELMLVECEILQQRSTLRAVIEHLEALNRRVEKIRLEIGDGKHVA